LESHVPASTGEPALIPGNKPGGDWKTFMTFVVGIGIVLLTALGGVSGINAGTSGSGDK